MQFSFLGYSVKKIMELGLDVKDITILRYFDDFRQSGRMNYEVIEGVNYYWVSYQSIENELPFLGLGKRSIMMKMLKLRDLGVLSHYTKKEGGTFSFYGLGDRYKELLYIKKDEANGNQDKLNGNNREIIEENFSNYSGQVDCLNKVNIKSAVIKDYYIEENNANNSDNRINNLDNATENFNKEFINKEESITGNVEGITEKLEGVTENVEVIKNFKFLEDSINNNEEGPYLNNHRGYSKRCSTKTNLLNNSSTIVTNIYNNIKDKVNIIIDYLNTKVKVNYKANNTKTINLIKDRLKQGFTIDDFKTVIDKKVKAWKGTIFEQYLTPFTLFGDKFEVYLNQKIVKIDERKNNNSNINMTGYKYTRKLKFDNFKGRDYDYDKLEKQLLGWQ